MEHNPYQRDGLAGADDNSFITLSPSSVIFFYSFSLDPTRNNELNHAQWRQCYQSNSLLKKAAKSCTLMP